MASRPRHRDESFEDYRQAMKIEKHVDKIKASGFYWKRHERKETQQNDKVRTTQQTTTDRSDS